MSDNQVFLISREFDAPRSSLWAALTEADQMLQWWGPSGVKVVKATMEFRPGGIFHYGMETPDGSVMWGRFVYREIVAPERIVFVNAFSDEAGGITRHPLNPTWPRELLSTFKFEEIGPKRSRLTVRWEPLNANDEERATFGAGHDSMNGGWGGTLNKLAAHLARV